MKKIKNNGVPSEAPECVELFYIRTEYSERLQKVIIISSLYDCLLGSTSL